MSFNRLGLFLTALMITGNAHGQELKLGLPVQCDMGETCFPVMLFDHDPGPEAVDYTCGRLSYDGHTGTDIAVPDLAPGRHDDIKVVAAADGRVRNTRDGMEDINVNLIGYDTLEGQDCGNGVVVQHDNGYETFYCHLKKGSIAVEPGQEVKKGDVLGAIGLSGNTSYPHMELALLKDGQKIDPFNGLQAQEGQSCSTQEISAAQTYWDEAATRALAHQKAAITKIGIATRALKWEEIKQGSDASLELEASPPALVIYTEGYALRQGDTITMRILDKASKPVYETVLNEPNNQQRFFRYSGKKAPEEGFPSGDYELYASIHDKQGELLVERRKNFTIQ